MALDIQQREREGIIILDLKGRITVGPEAGALREKIAALNAAGTRNMVLNMANVDYIDSTGLGALVMCATSLRKSQGNVKLLNLNRRNIELLVMTKLATVFEIFNDEQDAVNSFFPDRKIKTFDILSFVAADEKRGIAADGPGGHRRRGRRPERGRARAAPRSAPRHRGSGKGPRHLLRRLRPALPGGRPRARGRRSDRLHARIFSHGAQYRRAHRARAWWPSPIRAARWRSNRASACATTGW